MNAHRGLEMAKICTSGATAEKTPLISDYVFTTASPLEDIT